MISSHHEASDESGYAPLPRLTRIPVQGRDRATFLHNFTTAPIKQLAPGQVTEAFALDARGHVLGHLLVDCREQEIVLLGLPEEDQRLRTHFDRYIIREEVTLPEESCQHEFFLCFAPAGTTRHDDLPTWLTPGARATVTLAGQPARAIGLGCFGSLRATLVEVTAGSDLALQPTWEAAGLFRRDASVVDTLRVEAGIPLQGIDFDSGSLLKNLDETQAISFTKGCYLGQETVARIDALGHVNRKLCALDLGKQESCAAGQHITCRGKEVGKLTSVVYSPRLGGWLGMALVHRLAIGDDQELFVAGRRVTCCEFPRP